MQVEGKRNNGNTLEDTLNCLNEHGLKSLVLLNGWMFATALALMTSPNGSLDMVSYTYMVLQIMFVS